SMRLGPLLYPPPQAGEDKGGGRSPSGVPPRLSPRRVSHPQGSASGQASWDAAQDSVTAPAYPSSSDAPRTPVVMPAGMMPGPPGSKADEALPAGTALAPCRPASPGRRP
ncbi:MAG TPA: hypothetical protein VKS81_05575, partial [Bacteroidota bacterium]|nr:hypothetical protein [Bacteroidota bacterium]